MKPVLILQHLSGDGPAYLAAWLRRAVVPFEVRNSEQGQDYPDSIEGYGALAVLGGEMSANDPLPSLRQAEALILQAMDRSVPVLGHCLGGQLMARALGARVGPSIQPEVGWHRIDFAPGPESASWFGEAASAMVFQWHAEAFELPAGAQHLAGNAACTHQAFSLGPHLAMQFHIEVDEEKLGRWAADQNAAYLADVARYPTVQSGAQIRALMTDHLAAHQRMANRIYDRWLALAV